MRLAARIFANPGQMVLIIGRFWFQLLYHYDLRVAYVRPPGAYLCLVLFGTPVPLRRALRDRGLKRLSVEKIAYRGKLPE